MAPHRDDTVAEGIMMQLVQETLQGEEGWRLQRILEDV